MPRKIVSRAQSSHGDGVGVVERLKRTVWVANPRVLVIWHVAVLLLALAGPFGSFGQAPLTEALVYWWLVVGSSILLSQAVILLAERVLPNHGYWVQHGVVILPGFVCVYLPVLVLLTDRFHGGDAADLLSMPEKGLVVAAVASGIAVLRRVLSLRRGSEAPPRQAPAASVPDAAPPKASPAEAPLPDTEASTLPRLVQRLDPGLRAPLRRLGVNDHYVEVHTEAGHATVLIRFSDALGELGPVPGLQVHRSHWVADAAVAGLEQDDERRLWVMMTCGARVPVSRTYRAAVLARWGRAPRGIGSARGGPPRGPDTRIARASGPIRSQSGGRAQSSPPVYRP